jgi:hypothetical protein
LTCRVSSTSRKLIGSAMTVAMFVGPTMLSINLTQPVSQLMSLRPPYAYEYIKDLH